MIVGLERAHPACAGPLIELLLLEEAPIRVCFEAQELLDVPEGACVVLLNAARDAELLNLMRPVVAERCLRVLVWLRPGDRRELSRRARDFLDWMQESVDVPAFVPAYATEALHRVTVEGESLVWEGPPLRNLIPDAIVLMPGRIDDEDAIAAMQKGPVVIHRPRDADEVARFEHLHRMAGGTFGIVWEEPAVLPRGVARIVAEPFDWEVAAEWLASAGVDEPRLEAAKLSLDPLEISRRAGRELSVPEIRSVLEALQAGPLRVKRARLRGPKSVVRSWWAEVIRKCEPSGPPKDPALIVRRPAAWPGLGQIAERLRSRSSPGIHLVTGAPGSGVSTELLSLSLQLHERHCVVMLDMWQHYAHKVGDPQAFDRLTAWELVLLTGLAAIRVGRDRWGIRWGKETQRLHETIRDATGASVDVDRLAMALAGVAAPDSRMPDVGSWDLTMGTGRERSSATDRKGLDEAGLDYELIGELARVLSDGRLAMEVVTRAGFQKARIPRYKTPLAFWSEVVMGASNGVQEGSIRAIVEEASRMYPGNQLFARYRGARSRARIAQEHLEELIVVLGLVVHELRISTGHSVVLVVDGLGRSSRASMIDELTDALNNTSLIADVVLNVSKEQADRAMRSRYVRTSSHVDDVPVIDVREPRKQGPGIGFLRELLERRLASIPGERPSIPADVVDRLCWASGGRPSELLRLVRNLAEHVHEHPLDRLDELTVKVLGAHKRELVAGISREGHELLSSLLESFVSDVPKDAMARELDSTGLLRSYPTAGEGCRVLPHPLLIEDLIRS